MNRYGYEIEINVVPKNIDEIWTTLPLILPYSPVKLRACVYTNVCVFMCGGVHVL